MLGSYTPNVALHHLNNYHAQHTKNGPEQIVQAHLNFSAKLILE
jgi:hypothetical protein